MIFYIKFLAEGYVTEFTTALEAKEHLIGCGEGEDEKFYILGSPEPIEGEDEEKFKGYPFSVFEKDQIEEARNKIDEIIASPDSIKSSTEINNKRFVQDIFTA